MNGGYGHGVAILPLILPLISLVCQTCYFLALLKRFILCLILINDILRILLLTTKVHKDRMAVEVWIQPAIRGHQINFYPVQNCSIGMKLC
jgi:hypothetical protein